MAEHTAVSRCVSRSPLSYSLILCATRRALLCVPATYCYADFSYCIAVCSILSIVCVCVRCVSVGFFSQHNYCFSVIPRSPGLGIASHYFTLELPLRDAIVWQIHRRDLSLEARQHSLNGGYLLA